MLSLANLSVHYPGADAPVIREIERTIGPGSVALMGSSGSGKSTLLRCIAGLQIPGQGCINLDGKAIASRSRESADPRVAMVFQDHRLVDFLTVDENIRLALELRGHRPVDSSISAWLERVGLAGYGNRPLSTLSGGQLQRVGIARALALEPRLLLADEPTGSLDRTTSDRIISLLTGIARDLSIPVLIATHDPLVAAACDLVLELPGDGSLRVAA